MVDFWKNYSKNQKLWAAIFGRLVWQKNGVLCPVDTVQFDNLNKKSWRTLFRLSPTSQNLQCTLSTLNHFLNLRWPCGLGTLTVSSRDLHDFVFRSCFQTFLNQIIFPVVSNTSQCTERAIMPLFLEYSWDSVWRWQIMDLCVCFAVRDVSGLYLFFISGISRIVYHFPH